MCRKFWNRRKYRSKGTVQEIDCQTTERHFRNRKIIDPLWARIKIKVFPDAGVDEKATLPVGQLKNVTDEV